MRQTLYRSFSLLVLATAMSVAVGESPAVATTYTIVTTADDLTTNGNCTLREAVLAARTNAAVDACAAGSASGSDTIGLAAGTYSLPLGAIVATPEAELRIHGPAVDPPTAVITGGDSHRIFEVLAGAGPLVLEDLELASGNGLSGGNPLGGALRAGSTSVVARRVLFRLNRARRGGALAWYATGPGKSLLVDSCRFFSNEALHPDPADHVRGGALWLDPTGPAEVTVRDSDFVGNRAASALAGDLVAGGAIDLVTENSGSEVRFERLRLIDNVAESTGTGGSAAGGALYAYVQSATFALEDIRFDGNEVEAATSGAAALELFSGGSSVTLDRLTFGANGLAEGAGQASIFSEGAASQVVLRNCLAYGGVDGLSLGTGSDGVVAADHLTVADNSGEGLILAEDGGSLSLSNSVVFGNGTDLFVSEGSPTIRPETIVGIDPSFVDRVAGDYRLAAGSPAADAGDATWGFVGPYDLAHGSRVAGPETDLGAYERGALFSDGFASGGVRAWSAAAN